jgi:2,3-bisphosphoglycerate-independent phosphoglycerate mutase
MDLEFIKSLVVPADTKIVLLVMDGLGGAPLEVGGPTELEAADTPNLDELATQGICGLHQPIGPGITPGSGPSHQALFGYDPIKYQVGRGALSALGIDFDLQFSDVAARGNFCTVNEKGEVIDRRAGRISTEKNQELLELLRDQVHLDGAECYLRTVKEYRFLLVLRGEGLSGELADTDPQETGVQPLPPKALEPEAERTAEIVTNFVQQARQTLADHHPANMVLLRGFAQRPDWPTMQDVFGLRAAAIAAYPMYRGLAKLVGMTTFATGDAIEDEFAKLEQEWQNFDFFFVHIKKTDSYGEDGNFEKKVALIEEVDRLVPRITNLKPDVVIVTGDHSTPALIKSHSWHPVPVLLTSPYCRPDDVKYFGERTCVNGALGPRLAAVDIMPIALANAQRLTKFGA